MARDFPYFSTNEPLTYHTCSNCPEGQGIVPEDRHSGTGGGQKCPHCVDRERLDDCDFPPPHQSN